MKSSKPVIVYMGSADFAVPALEAICDAGYEVPYVVTQPDRVRGRGGKVLSTPVGIFAGKKGLKLLKPDILKDNEEFVKSLREAAPDLIVVAAYGKILPELILEIPPLGCVNIHASLLPEYRGAAPVQRAILDGKRETGVTLMYMSKGLDSGDIIASAKTDISGLNAGELTEVLAGLGAELLLEKLPLITDGTAPRMPQDGTKATYADKIEKDEGYLSFDRTAEEIGLRVRAMTDAPGAYIMKDGEKIGVTRARALDPEEESYEGKEESDPGTVLSVTKKGIAVRAKEGVVLIEAIRMPGRKAMPVAEYLKGNSFDAGSL